MAHIWNPARTNAISQTDKTRSRLPIDHTMRPVSRHGETSSHSRIVGLRRDGIATTDPGSIRRHVLIETEEVSGRTFVSASSSARIWSAVGVVNLILPSSMRKLT